MADDSAPLPRVLRRRLETYKAVLDRTYRDNWLPYVGNRPLPPLGDFIARPELDLIDAQLHTPMLRALLIVGAGGVGKTALAQRFIAMLERQRKDTDSTLGVDGIIYLSGRAGGISLERLYRLCAQLMGGDAEASLTAFWNRSDKGPEEKVERLVQKLQDGFYLIIFDDLPGTAENPASLPADVALFLQVLDKAPDRERVKVLAISREERLVSPYLARTLVSSGIALSPALDFLRAHGVSGPNDEILSRLIAAIKGAPRALQLIAAVLRQGLSPDDLLAALGDGGAPLEERLADLALRAFGALSPQEQRACEILAVFDQPVPAAAVDLAAHLLHGGEADHAPLLKAMADTGAVHGETMRAEKKRIVLFSLHDIDAFAIRANLGHRRAAVEGAAARFYRAMRRPKPWRHIRDADIHLIEAQHLARADDWAGVLAALDDADYSLRNHHKFLAHIEALGYGSFIVDQRMQLDAGLARRGLLAARASNLTSAAWVSRRVGRKREASVRFRHAVKLARASGDADALFYALTEYGYFLTDNAKANSLAERMLTRALAIAEATGSRYGQAHSALGLAFVHFQRQENDGCEREACKAFELFSAIDGPLAASRSIDALVRLSMLYRKQSRGLDAIEVTKRALAIAKRNRLDAWLGELESQLGFHMRAVGRYHRAVVHHRRAFARFGDPMLLRRQQAAQQSYLGNLLADVGDVFAAESAFQSARWIATSVDISRERNWIAGNWGILLRRLGDFEAARRLQLEGLDFARAHADSTLIRRTDAAETAVAAGRFGEAARVLSQALDVDKAGLLALADRFKGMPEAEDSLPHEMQAPGDHKRRGALLGRLLLEEGEAAVASAVLDHALGFLAGRQRRDPDLHVLAGIAALHQLDAGRAAAHLHAAAQRADEALKACARFYPAAFTRAVANYGLTMTGHRLPHQADHAWAKAEALCSAPGARDEGRALLRLMGGEPIP